MPSPESVLFANKIRVHFALFRAKRADWVRWKELGWLKRVAFYARALFAQLNCTANSNSNNTRFLLRYKLSTAHLHKHQNCTEQHERRALLWFHRAKTNRKHLTRGRLYYSQTIKVDFPCDRFYIFSFECKSSFCNQWFDWQRTFYTL